MGMDMTILFKLLLSGVFGLLIGIERELKHKPIGLKTCVIISVSSCLLTDVSVTAAEAYAMTSVNVRTDPMRLAAQVVSGIGFLGAGAILRRNNDVITGLTTAAMMWAASGVGIAVGAGFYLEAALGVVIILFAVKLLPPVLRMIGLKRLMSTELGVSVLVEHAGQLDAVVQVIKENGCSARLSTVKDRDDGLLAYLRVDVYKKTEISKIYAMLKETEGIRRVEIVG
jgi:putative Mg2+ transporter-C (MgtC) family protein